MQYVPWKSENLLCLRFLSILAQAGGFPWLAPWNGDIEGDAICSFPCLLLRLAVGYPVSHSWRPVSSELTQLLSTHPVDFSCLDLSMGSLIWGMEHSILSKLFSGHFSILPIIHLTSGPLGWGFLLSAIQTTSKLMLKYRFSSSVPLYLKLSIAVMVSDIFRYPWLIA